MLVKESPSDLREASYDAERKVLRVARFGARGLAECIQAEAVTPGRIVFSRQGKTGVVRPAEPPVWWSAEAAVTSRELSGTISSRR